jgi:hypothetical protein
VSPPPSASNDCNHDSQLLRLGRGGAAGACERQNRLTFTKGRAPDPNDGIEACEAQDLVYPLIADTIALIDHILGG